MSNKPLQLTGIVLAGGRSRRIGTSKALIPWENGKLIEHMVGFMERLFPVSLVMVKDPGEFLFLESPGVRVLRDLTRETHPLGGIYSGLHYSDTPYAFVCACDMPYIQPELVEVLWTSCEGYEATVPVWDDRPQPLCGIYSRDCLDAIKAMIDRKQYAIQELLRSVRTNLIREDEVKRVDPEGLSFLDIDTLEDYRRTRGMRPEESGSDAD